MSIRRGRTTGGGTRRYPTVTESGYSSDGSSPFFAVPPQVMQRTTVSPLPSTFQANVPNAPRLGGVTSLARQPLNALRTNPTGIVDPRNWFPQPNATPIPNALPGGGVNPFEAFRQWAQRQAQGVKGALPGAPAVAAAGQAATSAGALEGMAAAGPGALAAAMLGVGAYDQVAGDSATQYDIARQLPGFSSVPITPGGVKPTTSANYNIPGYGRQSITMPSWEPYDPGGGDGVTAYDATRKIGAPAPPVVDLGDGFSDPWADQSAISETDGEPGIRKPVINFDFRPYERLRQKSLADSMAAINAQYDAQNVGFDAEMAALGNEYARLLAENKVAKRQGIRDVESSGAGRGLLHSGVYAQGMAELMQGAANEKADIIGTYSTEEGKYGTGARDVESRRKLAEQTEASDIAAVQNASEKEKLELHQLEALLQAGLG